MEKIITVSIIGLGGRGGEAYGRYIQTQKNKFKITHVCDICHTYLARLNFIFNRR